jgi:4-diphosphocytidyl-2-C-methyl-D-erythritol kinase
LSNPTDRLAPVVRLAPAKLNLTLAVVGRRPDGFHALHSVMVPLEFGDRISIAPVAPPAGGAARDTLHVSGFDPGPPGDNLVLRAVAVARQAVRRSWPGAPAEPPPLAIRLEKRIPIAAGLAGGSSDAAAALDAALEAWGAELGDGERHVLASRLGSDVPFFLAAGPALVEGRGERVTALRGLRAGTAAAVLVTLPLPVSTAAVFAAFDAGARSPDPGAVAQSSRHLADELAAGALSAGQLADRAGVIAGANDLLAATAVVAPAVPPLRRSLARLLGRRIGQSGSGPTLWALYPSLESAAAAVAIIERALDDGTLATDEPRPRVVAAALALGERPNQADVAAAGPVHQQGAHPR